jgi:hypothetical protein
MKSTKAAHCDQKEHAFLLLAKQAKYHELQAYLNQTEVT